MVRNIIIEGNKVTKPYVIIREIGINPGDSIPSAGVVQFLERAKANIYNLKLFTNVNVNVKNWEEDGLDIHISVTERWYIIPVPIFQLADRNLNEWWVDRDRDFGRIQYGATLNWTNFRGRNETLKVSASLGFAQLLDFNYYMPHLSKNGRIGGAFNVYMYQSKRMPYTTERDKLQFYYDDNMIKRAVEIAPRVIIHRDIFINHYIEAKYSYRWIADKISELNQDYFLNGENKQTAIQLEYGFTIDKRNFRGYPTGGYMLKGSITNYGLGLQKQVNMTTASIQASKFFTLDKIGNHSTGHMIKLKGSYPSKQPYNIQNGLGYNQDFVRGYEYYVIDGQNYALFKNEYRYQVAALRLGADPKKAKPLLKQKIPIDIYFKAYLDGGYVQDKYFTRSNTLRNQWILGGGVGVDILLLFDRVIRIEYSLNKKMERGLFFHLELPM